MRNTENIIKSKGYHKDINLVVLSDFLKYKDPLFSEWLKIKAGKMYNLKK